jgi:hypothetical protein
MTQSDLGDLLLEIARTRPSRLATARKFARALADAMPMLSKPQQQIARARITSLETKWGSLLSGQENTWPQEIDYKEEIARIAGWLSTRKNPERLLLLVRRAVNFIGAGSYSLSELMDMVYAPETDLVVRTVGYDSFREWLIQLRVGELEKQVGAGPKESKRKQIVTKGYMQHVWEEMFDKDVERDKLKEGLYAASLKQLVTMQQQKLAARRKRERRYKKERASRRSVQKSQIA